MPNERTTLKDLIDFVYDACEQTGDPARISIDIDASPKGSRIPSKVAIEFKLNYDSKSASTFLLRDRVQGAARAETLLLAMMAESRLYIDELNAERSESSDQA